MCSCWCLATLCQVLSWNTCGASKSRSLTCKPHCLPFPNPTFRRAPNPDVQCNYCCTLLMFGSLSGSHSSSTAALPVDHVTLCCDLATQWDHHCFFRLGLKGLRLPWLPPRPRFLLWTIYFTYFLTNTEKPSVHWCFFFLASKALLASSLVFPASRLPLPLLQEADFLETLPSGLQVAAVAAMNFPPTHWAPTASSPLSLLKAESLLRVITMHLACEVSSANVEGEKKVQVQFYQWHEPLLH